MKKATTYFWYLFEYLKFGDIQSVFNAVNYLLLKKSHRKDRILKTSSGRFYCRKQTNDFQFANFRYEWNVKKFILSQIGDYNVFIDGGACNGEYSIWLAQNGYRCFAFEPVQPNYQVLEKNIELNSLTKAVKLFSCGLGDKRCELKIAFDPVNTGASSLVENTMAKQTQVAKVDTFDSFLPELKITKTDRSLFKLDIEGMEAEAITGAAKFIEQFDNILFVIEVKHSGKQKIIDTLNSLATFEIGDIDQYNIYAKKLSNHFN